MKEERLGILETIKRRRSMRKYTKEPVSEKLILKILEAGRWAPSAGNSQPWSFIILRDGKVRRKIADATTTGKFLANAPIGIAVVIDPRASKRARKKRPRRGDLLLSNWELDGERAV